jgi:hypothetical protein
VADGNVERHPSLETSEGGLANAEQVNQACQMNIKKNDGVFNKKVEPPSECKMQGESP